METENIDEQKVARLAKQPRLLNNSQVKKFILEYAGKTRHQKFTRVSLNTLQALEAHLKVHIEAMVRALPSKGCTI